MRKFFYLIVFLSLIFQNESSAQKPAKGDEDAFFIKKIYNTALTQGQCYPWLTHMTTRIGGRLAGSPQAAAAVEYTRQMLDTLNWILFGYNLVWFRIGYEEKKNKYGLLIQMS